MVVTFYELAALVLLTCQRDHSKLISIFTQLQPEQMLVNTRAPHNTNMVIFVYAFWKLVGTCGYSPHFLGVRSYVNVMSRETF